MRQIFGKSLQEKGGEFLVALKSRDFYSHEEFIRSERGINKMSLFVAFLSI